MSLHDEWLNMYFGGDFVAWCIHEAGRYAGASVIEALLNGKL